LLPRWLSVPSTPCTDPSSNVGILPLHDCPYSALLRYIVHTYPWFGDGRYAEKARTGRTRTNKSHLPSLLHWFCCFPTFARYHDWTLRWLTFRYCLQDFSTRMDAGHITTATFAFTADVRWSGHLCAFALRLPGSIPDAARGSRFDSLRFLPHRPTAPPDVVRCVRALRFRWFTTPVVARVHSYHYTLIITCNTDSGRDTLAGILLAFPHYRNSSVLSLLHGTGRTLISWRYYRLPVTSPTLPEQPRL